MMTVGASEVLNKHGGSIIAVAEAYILGKISDFEEVYAEELLSRITIEVARIRLKAKGLLNKDELSKIPGKRK